MMYLRLFSFAFISLFAVIANAQTVTQSPNGMSLQEHMRHMPMQELAKASACMQKIDMKAMEAAGNEAASVEAKIKRLCAEKREVEAEKYARWKGAKLMNMPAMQQMRACSETLASHMLANIPTDDKEHSSVCEHLKK